MQIHRNLLGRLRNTIFAASLAMFVGCAAQLAPPYDADIVTGINAVSVDALTLFSSTTKGTDASSYKERSEKYSALIGKLEAAEMLAGARPMPQSKIVQKVNAALATKGLATLTDDPATIPSVPVLGKLRETISKMRETDEKQGVTATEVEAFKGQAKIYIDQALTYEKFLQRDQGEK